MAGSGRQAAGGRRRHSSNLRGEEVVGSTAGAGGFGADVSGRADEIRFRGRVRAGLVILQRPGCLSPLDLAHIVDTGTRLARLPRLNKVWNRDGRQHTDDGHNDHDFYQRELLCESLRRQIFRR